MKVSTNYRMVETNVANFGPEYQLDHDKMKKPLYSLVGVTGCEDLTKETWYIPGHKKKRGFAWVLPTPITTDELLRITDDLRYRVEFGRIEQYVRRKR